jgi:hypothetical protein
MIAVMAALTSTKATKRLEMKRDRHRWLLSDHGHHEAGSVLAAR